MAKTPNIRGKLPLPAGKPIRVIKPSPAERAVLEKVGWTDGEPVPPELAKVIAEIQEDAAHPPPPVPITTKPFEPPEPIDLASLPPEKQAEYQELIRQLFDQAKEDNQLAEQRQKDAQEGLLPNAGPGINEAIQLSKQVEEEGLQIIDDRKQPETEPPEKPFIPVPCPHCGWPYGEPDPYVIDDLDKARFLESVLSGNTFHKQYELYGGRMVLLFRVLTPAEADAVYVQVRDDVRSGLIINTPDENEMRSRYFAISMLVKVVLGNRTYSMETLKSLPLNERLKELTTQVLTSEAHLRHVMLQAGEFRRLVDKLEVNAANPDFWQAAEISS